MIDIFIVEDEQVFLEEMVAAVQWNDYGFHICGKATDGLEALKQMTTGIAPQIIITDICMPGMNGFDFIQKTKIIFPNIEFIVLSDQEDFQCAKRAFKLGVNDYVLKPCRPEELIPIVLDTKQKIETRDHFVGQSEQIPKNVRTSPSPTHRTVQNALDIIHAKYQTNITLESVSKEVFVSNTYLSSLFKQQIGINFLDYLHQYRIEQAKLLLNQKYKIFAVAKLVGYLDERHFGITFKKWTGLTPTQFQKMSWVNHT